MYGRKIFFLTVSHYLLAERMQNEVKIYELLRRFV